MTDSIGNVSEESNHYGGYSDFSEREGDDSKETVSNPSSNNSERVNNLSDSKKMEITMALRHGISGRTEEAKRGLLDALPSTPKKNILGGITAITKKDRSFTLSGLQPALRGLLKKHSNSVSTTQPANESMLKINGVSYVLFADPKAPTDPSKSMAFPVSHTSDLGGAAVPSATSTEAIWYTLENAYDADDQQLFQQTLNGYLYLVQQKVATVAGTDWASTPGLAGWIIDLGTPPGTTFSSGKFPYPQGNPGNPNLSTATDADEQIINQMLKGIEKFGDLTLHAFGAFPSSSSPQDIKMSDLTRVAVETFLYNNIAGHPASIYDKAHHGFKYQGVVYNPVLSNDNWGGGGWTNDPKEQNQGTFLNPSYFDPHTLANIYAYVLSSSDPKINSQADAFKTAMINTVGYLTVLQAEYQDKSDPSIAGMPDNPAWNENDGPNGNGPHPIGWDSIRFLTNVGKYVDYCENKGGTDPFGILSDFKEMGTKMLGYVIKNSINLYMPNMTLGATPKGANLEGGALLGPLLVAMKALTPNDPNIATVQASLTKASEVDMAQMDPKSGSAYSYWQSIYYGTELALVNAFDADQI
ncbi:MAG: hypothetical protein KFB93_00670 [Simkaniaceae bacterium]|nr:MAG: hypothetical protein KFB93_00670 [Simkaniaceae bacterium]